MGGFHNSSFSAQLIGCTFASTNAKCTVPWISAHYRRLRASLLTGPHWRIQLVSGSFTFAFVCQPVKICERKTSLFSALGPISPIRRCTIIKCFHIWRFVCVCHEPTSAERRLSMCLCSAQLKTTGIHGIASHKMQKLGYCDMRWTGKCARIHTSTWPRFVRETRCSAVVHPRECALDACEQWTQHIHFIGSAGFIVRMIRL